ncbi:MAG: UDP-glucose/GDP-mannose dehydrogenase family protein [Spirochaetia bacterium]|nr:UDP-glucose/GDP-mannose dehydrogenase family protein [Spirochaetia bacterium]
MQITVVGSGYVGLVAGTCFAEYGNQVNCVDIDERKIENLKKGILPIYEPGLSEMVLSNFSKGRLVFLTDLKKAVESSDIVFIAVGTPDRGDGKPDLSGVLAVAAKVGEFLNEYKVIVTKSTVPVGTADQVREAASKGAKHPFDVVSNPEFLREGRAIDDFMEPERIVVGCDSDRSATLMRELYNPFVQESGNPLIVMSIRSAELTKYACNAFLAMKISFVNEIANLCDALGANYLDVRTGMGTDSRIGKKFLNAGIGYGGSCFPKDVRALVSFSEGVGLKVPLFDEVEQTNEKQKGILVDKIIQKYGQDLKGKKFAVWGLAFKPGTDDMREAPSLTILNRLIKMGAEIAASDPVAVETARPHLDPAIQYGEMYSVIEGADALLLLTEWPAYLEPDFRKMKAALKAPVIFDGRNVYPHETVNKLGFTYYGMGVT